MTELEYLTRIANSLAAERQSENIAAIQSAASGTEKAARTADDADRKPSA